MQGSYQAELKRNNGQRDLPQTKTCTVHTLVRVSGLIYGEQYSYHIIVHVVSEGKFKVSQVRSLQVTARVGIHRCAV